MKNIKKMQNFIKSTLCILILVNFSACGSATSARLKKYTLLSVENYSQKDIFISLVSNGFKESFGGIPPSGSAGIGFSPLRFGNETEIQYSEETIDENNRFTIKTDILSEFKDDIGEVIFRYLGNEQWVLVLIDMGGNETFPNRKGS